MDAQVGLSSLPQRQSTRPCGSAGAAPERRRFPLLLPPCRCVQGFNNLMSDMEAAIMPVVWQHLQSSAASLSADER